VAGEVLGKRYRRLVLAVAPLRLLLQATEALLLLLVWAVAAPLPPAAASRVGAALFARVGPRLAKSRHVRRNLAFALPDAGAATLARTERACWATLGAVLAEMPHLRRIADLSRDPPAVELVAGPGGEGVMAQVREGRAFVFVTAHLGNWELLPRLLVQHGREVAVAYTPQGNPLTDGLLQWRRRTAGIEFVGRRGGVRALLQALRSGRSLGLLVDLRSDEGEPVPFFGVPALTSTAPARLAAMAGTELIPTRVERLGPARFRVTVEAPVRPADPDASASDRALDVTAQVNARFADWIRARPGDWLCTKRRFPKEVEPVA